MNSADETATTAAYARLHPDREVVVRGSVFAELYDRALHAVDSPSGRLGEVPDIARHFGCAPSTARAWCAAGFVPGAYRVGRLGWRFSLAAGIAALEERFRSPNADDLGAWRQKRSGAA